MAAIQLPTYAEFVITDDPSVATKWNDWLDGFEYLLRALKVDDNAYKRTLLLHYTGTEVRKLFKKLQNTGGNQDYDAAKKALTDYFSPKMNRVFLMNTLQQIKQLPGESIDTFYMRIGEKMHALELDAIGKEEIIELVTLSQLVTGCADANVRKKALKDGLKLEDFVKTARSFERADLQMKEMTNDESVVRSARTHSRNRGGRSRYNNNRGPSRPQSPGPRHQPPNNRGPSRPHSPGPGNQTPRKTCYRCGGEFPHKGGPCAADGKNCNFCKKPGHLQKVCLARKNHNRRVEYREEPTESDEEYVTVPRVTVAALGKLSTPKVELKCGDIVFSCIVDTGAEVSTINESTYKKLHCELQKPKKSLYSYGSEQTIPVIGCVKLLVKSELTNKTVETEFYVIKGNTDNLLCCKSSVELELVNFAFSINSSNDVMSKFQDRFEGMGKMKDIEVKLHINQEVKPIEQKTRRVPFHLREQVEEELKRLEESDIIEKAEGPTPWVSPIVVVHKKNGVRICIDSRAINTAIERERHPIPTIEDLIVDLNGAQVFSKIDLNKGYHQIQLAPESRYITCFTTHTGLWRYKRLSFGINSAAEIFQKAISDMLQGIDCVKNISDDIIVYTKDTATHTQILEKVFQRMREYNITANKEKCEFYKDAITFYGHNFSKNGISADEDKVFAIIEAETPKEVSELRSFLGMAQYIARFIPGYSDIVAPLQNLTHQDVPWKWGENEEKAFSDLKASLTNSRTIKYFDIKLPTEVIVDASPTGLGGILTQREPDGNVRVVAYGSRKLSEVESRYSQTEREALAVVWASEHFHTYLFGAEYVVITDHKPLEGILNKPTSKPTARLERMCLRLLPYKMKVVYKPGKDNHNPADYLSRHPKEMEGHSSNHRSWLDQQLEKVYVNAILEYNTQYSDAVSLQEIKQATLHDELLQKLIQIIASQTWDKIHDPLFQSFKNVKDELTVADGIILRGDRIVIPSQLQKKVVNIAHSSHQGIVKTKKFLRETVWFSGLDKLVETTVANCLPCQAATHRPVQHLEPLQMTQLPTHPWKQVSVDFCGPFKTGEHILVVIDDYSRFPEIEIVHSTSAAVVIPRLDAIFARQGVPEILRSDNGAPFNGQQFTKWASTVGFHHRKVTPLWPRANGEAENFMKTLGKAVRTAQLETGNWKQQLFHFLRHYRATPHTTTSVSPAELLNGRKLRTELPVYKSPVKKVQFMDERLIKRDERMKMYMKMMADARNHAKKPELEPGDHVLIKQQKKEKLDTPFRPEPYQVIERKGSMVTAERGGHTVTRNSSFLKKIPQTCGTLPSQDDILLSDPQDVSDLNRDQSQDDSKAEQTGISQPRRSGRQTNTPSYLQDYVH